MFNAYHHTIPKKCIHKSLFGSIIFFKLPFTSSTPIPTTSNATFQELFPQSSILGHTYIGITPIQSSLLLILHFYTPILDGRAHYMTAHGTHTQHQCISIQEPTLLICKLLVLVKCWQFVSIVI